MVYHQRRHAEFSTALLIFDVIGAVMFSCYRRPTCIVSYYGSAPGGRDSAYKIDDALLLQICWIWGI